MTALACAAQTPAFAPGKKGIGLAESTGLGMRELTALKVDWYYNWGASSSLPAASIFVPMAFSPKRVADLPSQARYVLGFNEPDNAQQSNVTPRLAFEAWGALGRKAEFLGSPALARNPLTPGNWLEQFLGLGGRVDFIAVHWYKGVDARKFIDDMQAICAAYGKPVWVTEFAPQTAAQARAEPQKFSQAQVDHFIRETSAWMTNSTCVHRYAWHDAKLGSSALFEGGQLTATGRTYASMGR
ncbi:MAG: glycosyl hydrolase [Betaproteobacteria bacterium]